MAEPVDIPEVGSREWHAMILTSLEAIREGDLVPLVIPAEFAPED